MSAAVVDAAMSSVMSLCRRRCRASSLSTRRTARNHFGSRDTFFDVQVVESLVTLLLDSLIPLHINMSAKIAILCLGLGALISSVVVSRLGQKILEVS